MRRTRTGKRIELTTRDFEIFKLLGSYRYLRSTYIHAFVGGASVRRFKERLGDLFHEGYLDRPEEQWRFAGARYQPAVHEVGAGAARALREAGNEPDRRSFLGESGHRQFLHSLMVCETLASIDLAARGRPGLRLVGWPEILAKAPEATRHSPLPQRLTVGQGAIIPDGLFGLEYNVDGVKSYRFFALELDRGTMPLLRSDARQTSHLAKLDRYREAIASGLHKAHWGLPNLLVLTVMADERRASTALTRLRGSTLAQLFLFKSIHPRELDAPLPNLLAATWQRPGLEPFDLGRP